MTRVFALVGVAAAVFLMVAAVVSGPRPAQAEELAQTADQMCFYNCINKYGSSAKASCAMQCGVVQSPGAGGRGQQRDCGTIFKQCLQACGNDQNCQNRCRNARMQCY